MLQSIFAERLVENLESKKHLLYAVRIIFERQEIENIWESHKWVVNDLIPLNVSSGEGYPPINDVRIYPLLNDIKTYDSHNKNFMLPMLQLTFIVLKLRDMQKIFNHQILQFTLF